MGYAISCPSCEFKSVARFEVKAIKKAVRHSKQSGHMGIKIQQLKGLVIPTKEEIEKLESISRIEPKEKFNTSVSFEKT